MQSAQESECACQRDSMGEECRVRSQTSGPNRLNHFRKRRFAKRANRQAGEGNAELHARNDAMQITEECFNHASPGIPLRDQLPDA